VLRHGLALAGFKDEQNSGEEIGLECLVEGDETPCPRAPASV